MGLIGVLLLVMALAPTYPRRFSVSTSTVYLLVGLALGPAGAGLLALDARQAQPWLDRYEARLECRSPAAETEEKR
jgi:NhaP-type Na+/H+ or K+/H+ antiporter